HPFHPSRVETVGVRLGRNKSHQTCHPEDPDAGRGRRTCFSCFRPPVSSTAGRKFRCWTRKKQTADLLNLKNKPFPSPAGRHRRWRTKREWVPQVSILRPGIPPKPISPKTCQVPPVPELP